MSTSLCLIALWPLRAWCANGTWISYPNPSCLLLVPPSKKPNLPGSTKTERNTLICISSIIIQQPGSLGQRIAQSSLAVFFLSQPFGFFDLALAVTRRVIVTNGCLPKSRKPTPTKARDKPIHHASIHTSSASYPAETATPISTSHCAPTTCPRAYLPD